MSQQLIKILIAEDDSSEREILEKYIKDIPGYECDITAVANADKGISLINAAVYNYDVIFADIDFTKARGRSDDGFRLIEKAFNKWPLTIICTYSAQYSSTLDNNEFFIDLIKRGLINQSFDKRAIDISEKTKFQEKLINLFGQVHKQQHYNDVWFNLHQSIERIKSNNVNQENIIESSKPFEIIDNLESIRQLLTSQINYTLSLRLIIYLIHRSLELYCEIGKEYPDGMSSDFAKNLAEVKKWFNYHLEPKSENSALSKILAYSCGKEFEYGYKLNQYRNDSIHPNTKYDLTMIKVLYSVLTFSLYVVGKENLKTENIEKYAKENPQEDGIPELYKLIKFIKT